MIDIHTHILPGVDDGAATLEQAIAMLKEAEEQGIKQITATPHFLAEEYQLTPAETRQKVKQLQQVVEQLGLDITILPGAEVFLRPELGKLLDQGKVTTLNQSRYILIEFPHNYIPKYVNDVFYDLKMMNYIPVISHPERCEPIREKPNHLYYWAKDGIYAQLNASSLTGVFGPEVQKTAEILVKHNLVQVMGSDAHSTGSRRFCLEEGLASLEKLGLAVDYFLDNAARIINDQDLEPLAPVHYGQNGLFKKVKQLVSPG